MLGPEYPEIAAALPSDHARISSAAAMLQEAAGDQADRALDVLDLGCGGGDGIDVIHRVLPKARYFGVDIESSPEVDARRRADVEFQCFDGVTLPYADSSMDIVYSRQVYEHVRHPDPLTREVWRVLKPGGLFLGSMSNLEPYHSYSIFNYTPYGVFRLVTDNGFSLERLRPGPEGLGMILRQITMRRINNARFCYPLFSIAARLRGWDTARLNYYKLRFSGHVCFIARKPA